MYRKTYGKQLKPISQPKTTASTEGLLLTMFNSFLKEQKQTNKLLHKILNRDNASTQMSQNSHNVNERSIEEDLDIDKPFPSQKLQKSRELSEREDSILGMKSNNENKKQDRYDKDYFNKESTLHKPMEQIKTILIDIKHMMSEKNQKQISKDSFMINDNKTKKQNPFDKPFQNVEIEKLAQNPKDLIQQFENKKNYSIVSELLPYSDRREIKIKIPFSEMIDYHSEPNIEIKKQIEIYTQQWLGVVFRATASICWNNLSNDLLNFDETKILFTENIVYNFVNYMKTLKKMGLDDERYKMVETINDTSNQILEFLCKQYPQTTNSDPNIALREKIKLINNKGRSRYDLITGVTKQKLAKFNWNQEKQYTSDIMKTINYMIERTNVEYDNFKEQMQQLFEEIYLPLDKRRLNKTNILASLSNEDRKYFQQVKKYTSFKIGRKIHKNTLPYNNAEIQNKIFFVQSNSILRIVTKWVEQLSDVIKNPEWHIKNAQGDFKTKNGKSTHIYSQARNGIVNKINQHREDLDRRLAKIKKESYQLEVLLTQYNFTKEKQGTHLSEDQISVGKFCTHYHNAMSAYIFSELSEIIDFLLQIPLKVRVSKLGITQGNFQQTIKKDLQELNLVSCKVFDLLRCKCNSNQSEIIYILERIYERNNDPNDPFTIVRIKDRLNLGTRDILINAQLNNGLVCQIQLSVTSKVDKKQELLNNYEHFLYELLRSKLGPISESASIWSSLEQRAIFFEDMIKKKKKNCIGEIPHTCTTDFTKTESASFTKFIRPIKCQSCQNFFEIPRTCLMNIKCNKCSKTYCGECHFNHLSSDKRKQFVFEKNFFLPFYQNMQEYTDFQKPFPVQGFIIRKFYLNKQLLFFRLIRKNKADNYKKQGKVLIELIKTCIVKGKAINKTIGKQQIEASIVNGQYYISKNHQNYLKEFIIYEFKGESLKIKIESWSSILEEFKGKKYKFLNLLHSSSFISDLKVIKKEVQIKQEIDFLFEACSKQTQITYLVLNKKVILCNVYMSQQKTQELLVRQFNLRKLKKYASDEANSISLEFKNITDEISAIFLTFPQELYQNFTTKVTKLYLSFNEIESLFFVKSFKNLKVLYMRKNKLKTIQGVENCNNLTIIDISENLIESLEPLNNLKMIEYIRAGQNKITTMKGIQELTQLKKIVLYNNKIDTIDYTQKLSSVQELQVNGNPIKQLSNIDHMRNLEQLTLGNTLIDPLKLDVIGTFSKMKRLLVNHLKIKSIGAIFLKLTCLEKVDFSKNQIEKIQNLENCLELIELKLSNNRISKIQNLEELTKIQDLKLKGNNIKSIGGIRKLTNLKYIGISENPLEQCPDLFFKNNKNFIVHYTKRQSKDAKVRPSEIFYKNLDEMFINRGTSSSGSGQDSDKQIV